MPNCVDIRTVTLITLKRSAVVHRQPQKSARIPLSQNLLLCSGLAFCSFRSPPRSIYLHSFGACTQKNRKEPSFRGRERRERECRRWRRKVSGSALGAFFLGGGDFHESSENAVERRGERRAEGATLPLSYASTVQGEEGERVIPFYFGRISQLW